MKKIFCITLTVLVLFPLSLQAQQVSRPYDYPIKPGLEQWKAFTTRAQKQEACQIPQQLLNTMSTADLVETCLNYPLYGDMMAYNRVQDGFDFVSSGFNGLQELLSREDAGVTLIERYRNLDPHEIDTSWSSVQMGELSYRFFSLEILIAQDKILSVLSGSDRMQLLKDSYAKATEKQKYPEIYGLVALTNNIVLIGRIMLLEEYTTFTKLTSENERLKEMLQRATIMDRENMREILEHAEQYIY